MILGSLAAPLLWLACIVLAGKPCAQKQSGLDRIVCVCNATYCDTIDALPSLTEGQYVQYTSNIAGLRFEQTIGAFNEKPLEYSGKFTIDASKTYQTMIGFGTAFTDSGGLNVNSLSYETQENLLKSYFSPEGIEMNIGRVPIAGTDFSSREYTYDDVEEDITLEYFNLTTEDFNYKIPLLKRAIAMNRREFHLMASAWSSPTWMKTNHKSAGIGYLLDQYREVWARYHIKFLDAYAKECLHFWSVSTGNEPGNGVLPLIEFNSLGWTPNTQMNWVRDYFGPAIRNSAHNCTKIVTLEDQRIFLAWWTLGMVLNPKAANYIDGITTHWYSDAVTSTWVLDFTHRNFPNKFLLSTEASSAFLPWNLPKVLLGSWHRGEMYMQNIFQNLQHWSAGWVDWNLALDTKGGPNWANNFVDSAVIVNSQEDEFYKQPMFYALGHFAKFVPKGSVRISITPHYDSGVQSIAFKNPENATVIVLYNKETAENPVTIRDPNKGNINLVMTKRSFQTIVYWN